MRRNADGRWLYSPTDLVRFHGSTFAAWMDRRHAEDPESCHPDPQDDEQRIVAELGRRHEEAHVRRLRDEGRSILEVPRGTDAVAATVEALRTGQEVVVQGALRLDPFEGYVDFLERVPGRSVLGDFRYEIADTKLAASERPGYLLQLCAYAEMLEAVQGCRPERVHLILRGGERRSFRTDDYLFVYRRVKADFLAAMSAFRASEAPEPDIGGDWGRWSTEAERRLVAADSLALVAGIRGDHVRKLRAAGIETVATLARARAARVPGLRTEMLDRLREQAALQVASRGGDVPRWKVVPPPAEEPRRGLALLPPRSPGDVYFDMEGYPLGDAGLEYLFGAATDGRREADYVDWWGHDALGERRAFEGFVRWVTARRARHPGMHVYHYAPYERSALRRLMGTHAACEEEVDALLRDDVLVDVYAVVRQGLRVGTTSYSLKALEVLYGRRRSGDVRTSGESIVAYHRWIESGEPRDPARSPILAGIRSYNREDCVSTREFVRWLRERQEETGLAWVPPGEPEDPAESTPESPALGRRDTMRELAEELLASIPDDPTARRQEEERWRITEMLGHLLEFHRREARPVWWSLFDRDAMDEEQRTESPTCLAGMERLAKPAVDLKRSKGWWYRFDPSQETRVGAGSNCLLAGALHLHCTVEEMSVDGGRALVKFGPGALAVLEGQPPPATMTLLLHEHVDTTSLEESLLTTATAWHERAGVRPAVRDLLLRRPPRVKGHRGGPLVREGEDPVEATVRLVRDLRDSVLCVQGPPGTGKTYTAARAIAALVKDGRRVGVASNSHKAILNLLAECGRVTGASFECLKVSSRADEDHEAFLAAHSKARCVSASAAARVLPEHLLVGGTAWYFSRPEVEDEFDVLFVDEAGQVALANLLAMAPCAKSLVLLGDPMQLPQPTQGSHPGDSGLSSLDHVLAGHATVPPEFGVFLPTTRRLHPDLCGFISGAFYEDRLRPSPETERRRVRVRTGEPTSPSPRAPRVRIEAGLVFVPVPHEGNGQRSDEEVAAIQRILEELVGRPVTNAAGRPAGTLHLEDVVIVAPYNLQVRALRAALPSQARVGTVDKFQGQQARVSIVALTASDAEAAGRGLTFLLDRRRLNVAISRAESLSIVVGSPSLAASRCRTVDEMRLLNTLCRMLENNGVRPSCS